MSKQPPKKPPPPPDDNFGPKDEGADFFEFVLRMTPIDPAIGVENHPVEATRDDIQRLAKVPVEPESMPTPPELPKAEEDRANLLGSQVVAELDKPLKELAADAGDKVSKLLKEAGARAAGRVLANSRSVHADAEIRFQKALRDLHGVWDKCVPTKEECVKDLIKWCVRCAVVYGAWELLKAGGS